MTGRIQASHPCKGLSPRAHEVFEQIAIGNDLAGHHPRVLATLVERGLIERHEEVVEGPLPGTLMTIHRFDVPLPVHMAWCTWCAENVSMGEIEGATR